MRTVDFRAMRRVLAVLALALVGGVAGGLGVATPAAADPSAAGEGTISPTVRTWPWGDVDQVQVQILYPGDSTSPLRLVSKTGAKAATATIEAKVCSGDPKSFQVSPTSYRVDQPAPSPHCLTITGLTPGESVAGTIVTNDATFTRTVNPREGLPGAVLWVLAGLAIAALALALSPTYLGPLVRRQRIRALIRRNERSQANRIEGLTPKWLDEVYTNSRQATDESLLRDIGYALANGPRLLADRRADLQVTMARATALSRNSTLKRQATKRLQQPTVSVDDLFDREGALLTRTWPEDLAAKIAEAQRILESLAKVANDHKDNQRALHRVAELREDVSNSDGENLEKVAGDVEDLSDRLANAGLNLEVGRRELFAGKSVEEALDAEPAATTPAAPAAPSQAPPSRVGFWRRRWDAVAPWVLPPVRVIAIALAVGIAVATILSASYLGSDAFGTFLDNANLVISAATSAVVVGVLGILVLGRIPR